MERKSAELRDVSVTDSGTFEGYGAVFDNVDAQNDEIKAGAFAGTLSKFLERGFVSWNHDWSVPIAYPTAIRETPKGLLLRGNFHTTDDGQRARRIAAERAAAGLSIGLSIGYDVLPGGAKTRRDGVRELTKLDLVEIAMTLTPANELATLTAVKSRRDDVRAEARRAAAWAKSLLAEIPPEPAGHVYYVIPAAAVAERQRTIVENALQKSAACLGVNPPSVKYIRAATEADLLREKALAEQSGFAMPLWERSVEVVPIYGYATHTPPVIYIDGDRDEDRGLARTVSHECAHLAGGDEDQAQAFAESFAAEWRDESPDADHARRMKSIQQARYRGLLQTLYGG